MLNPQYNWFRCLWHKAKEDLKEIIQHVGPPTFFFTFSSADMHWPQLVHDLFQNTCNINENVWNAIPAL